jgi:hypothetical protein
VRSTRILVLGLVAIAALVPAASAASHKKHHRLRIELVPLQTAQLGAAGASLPIQFDSGKVGNGDVESALRKLGRVSGYQLDYGDFLSGGAGVTSIATQIEQFRTATGARKAVKFWKKNDEQAAAFYRRIGVGLSNHFFKTRAVGSGHFAYATLLQITNADPLYLVDEVASSGRFVLHATIGAGTESAAEQPAPALTARLAHRLRELLGGHLHGKPPRLPRAGAPGPPPGGPDLSMLVLAPSDFTGPAAVSEQGYEVDPTALSSYQTDLRPAGRYVEVQQSVTWFANDNETTWEGTLLGAILIDSGGSVDLAAVGDNAHGEIVTDTNQALVVMWKGQALDLATAQSATTIQPSDVQALAQAMADHLNTAPGG